MDKIKIPSTFEEAYSMAVNREYLKTHDGEFQFMMDMIDSYKKQGIEARWRKGKINPKFMYATQEFVELEEYELISELMKNGEYTTPSLVEMHPRFLHGMGLVVDGHNRTRWNSLHGVDRDDAWIIYFLHGEGIDSGLLQTARGYDMFVRDMPVKSKSEYHSQYNRIQFSKSGNEGYLFKDFTDITFMKPAEALRLVDILSKEIEVEDTSFSLVRLRTCV